MKKNICLVCLKIRGKRLCKLREKSFVCSHCCAEIRNIDCEGCSHYIQAEKYSLEKKEKSQFSEFTAIFDPEINDAVDKALAMVERGNIEAAEKSIIDLMKNHSNLHIVQYGMGTVLAMKGQYAASIVHFDNSLKIFPYFVEAWFNRGNSYKFLCNVGEAIKSFQKVIEFGNPREDFVKAAEELVDHMEKSISKDTGLSLDQYLKSIDDFNKAFSTMQKREYTSAIKEFENVIILNKTSPQTYGNLGLCYAFLGQQEQAIAAFDQALKIDPNYAPAITNRATVLSLENGEKLPDDHVLTVEYYKDILNK
jgi:tetratricopeptide (TPR) repeat protein